MSILSTYKNKFVFICIFLFTQNCYSTIFVNQDFQYAKYVEDSREERSAIPVDRLTDSLFKKCSKSILNYHWYTLNLTNTSENNIDLCFYLGKNAYLELYDLLNSSIPISSAGFANLDEAHLNSILFPSYQLDYTLPANTEKYLFIKLYNYGKFGNVYPIEIFRKENYLDWSDRKFYKKNLLDLIHPLIFGGILVLAFMMLIHYFQNKKKEYFFYSIYGLLLFIFLERAFEFNANIRILTLMDPLYFYRYPTILNLLTSIPYILFLNTILELKVKNPSLLKFSKAIITINLILLIIFLYLTYRNNLNQLYISFNLICNFFPAISLLCIIVCLIYLNFKNRTIIYISFGFIFLFLGTTISIVLNHSGKNTEFYTLPPVTYLEIGALLEVLFLSLALGYKSKESELEISNLQIKNLEIQLESNLKIQSIHDRISRDLHDDIGSTLSSINILSRENKSLLQNVESNKDHQNLQKIHIRSQRLLEQLKDIIWNIDPGNNTFGDLFSHMREYAAHMFENSGIQYILQLPEELDNIGLSFELKSTVYLIYKEAVNNICKHSECNEAKIVIELSFGQLTMTISDNGKGFEPAKVNHIRGLHNMQKRSQFINGEILIESSTSRGTCIKVKLPFK